MELIRTRIKGYVVSMEKITVTAKVQIIVKESNKLLLNNTMSKYTDACNYVSSYIFKTHEMRFSIVLLEKNSISNLRWLNLF